METRKYQVMRSQAIAPSNAARMTNGSTIVMSISPEPIVFATAVPNTKTAAKLKKAAYTTAVVGERTRVETTVAIALAASWKPLMKSNAKAITMIARTNQMVSTIRHF